METFNKPRIVLKAKEPATTWTTPSQSLPPIRTPIKLKPKSKSLGFSDLIKKGFADTVSFQYQNELCVATVYIGEEPVSAFGQGPLEAFQNLMQDLTRINFEE